jgi:death-on-curing protein
MKLAIAAASAFHIAESQDSLDGNKRTAIASALVFLEKHGIATAAPAETLHNAMIAISDHWPERAALAAPFWELFARA